MNVQYKWILLYDNTSVEVHPIYKDDMALEYQHETNQMFFRGKLTGKINLVGTEADYIINAPFYTEFNLLIQKRTNNVLQWSDYYQCRFYKTDCTINEDNHKVSVQPSVVDAYNEVLNGLEKEYNILEFPIKIQPIIARKRPMLQIYTQGEDIVSCVSGGSSFETDRINEDVSPTSCHFYAFSTMLEINIESSLAGFSTPFLGHFKGIGRGSEERFYNSDGIYYIQYWEERVHTSGLQYEYWNGLRIYRMDNTLIWSFAQVALSWQQLPNSITFVPEETYSALGNLTGDKHEYNIYSRLVLDITEIGIGGDIMDTYKIGNDDIVANNRNYRYCIPYEDLNLTQSNNVSDTPTKWGRRDDGKYFLPPDNLHAWIPVGRSQWINSSIWFYYDTTLYNYENAGVRLFNVKDSYSLSSVISVLLSQVAPNITHEDAAVYSHFFYDDAQTSGIAALFNDTRPFITPKSNILVGEYTEPAQKAPCTLKTIFDMLKNVYGCYWYIDGSNRLIIEHLYWFKNGGSYNVSPSVGFDLTSLENAPNGKKWAFGTSEYAFDKQDMPARYQYAWMDEVTDIFKGNPVNILSPFVQQDKVEEVNIANFTSDVSYMLLAPDNCSKDGFALLHARQLAPNSWSLPLELLSIDGMYYYIQNYYVSMRWLQANLLDYDMPSWSIELNGTATTAAGIKRNKQQELSFPVGVNDPNLMQLVKTYIGNGQISKMSINLSSRTAKVTLKYNTYDN